LVAGRAKSWLMVDITRLGPPGALLVAVADAVGRLPDRQVLVQVPAVPAVALHLHAQRKVLRQRPRWRPPRLLQGSNKRSHVADNRGIQLLYS